MELSPEQSQLGKKSEYESTYNPDKLFPILRANKRSELGINGSDLPFFGFDIWNHYEVSWLNEKGKPIVATAQLIINYDTPYLIESKSMKLYFNSLNNTKFKDETAVAQILKKDLEQRLGSTITVIINPAHAFMEQTISASFQGECLDHLDIDCTQYTVDRSLLLTQDIEVVETVYSDLLKSNCLVTGQPDWGSIQISYVGNKINHASLLRYIVSFRNHTEFGEHCIERIFVDIMQQCAPKVLTIDGRYTRRGGIDISAIRSTQKMNKVSNTQRLWRQ